MLLSLIDLLLIVRNQSKIKAINRQLKEMLQRTGCNKTISFEEETIKLTAVKLAMPSLRLCAFALKKTVHGSAHELSFLEPCLAIPHSPFRSFISLPFCHFLHFAI